MDILILGSGGREHALTWKLQQSNKVNHIFVSPGNAGTQMMQKVTNVELQMNEIQQFVVKNKIQMVIPGSEVYLVEGIVDQMKSIGVMCFGPSKAASKLEGSKAFSKHFMKKHGIPTSDYRVFNDFKTARDYVNHKPLPFVIKASGLAQGKGVIVPETKQEALDALDQMFIKKQFGDAANEVIIEDFVEGEEMSVLCFSDGYTVKMMPPAKDHKRIFDNDKGPNTGGMGAVAPSIPKHCNMQNVLKILQKTIDAMRMEKTPFVGVLFAGFMCGTELNVLEYNARFGDPETQVLMPLLESDLLEIMLGCILGYLDKINIKFSSNSSCCVCLCSRNYPESKELNVEVPYPQPNTLCFVSGAVLKDKVRTSGGRVLCVTSVSSTISGAIQNVYSQIPMFKFDGMQYRTDIGSNINSKKTYVNAGVSISLGNLFVQNIKKMVKSTMRPGADAELGGFGGLFDLKQTQVSDPILVACTDGVGTKLKLAIELKNYSTIGQDLVAMSVNDVVVQGAEPLFFLDYYACGHLDLKVAEEVVLGITKACKETNCALIGGETAEMPGLYQNNDFDLAGFAVGIVSRQNLLPKLDEMKQNDALMGLSSSGLHSNGFSLVRHLIKDMDLDLKFKGVRIRDLLLTPTKLYVNDVLLLTKKGLIKGAAHITGGGLEENIARVIPSNLKVELGEWDLPLVFEFLQQFVEKEEMQKTFNCGIGMVLICDEKNIQEIQKLTGAIRIGKIN